MLLKSLLALLLVVLSMLTDIKSCRIQNSLILISILSGAVVNIILSGMEGLIFSIAGLLLPVVLLFVLFALGMLGAGDIKLFGALGSILGVWQALHIIVYSFLFGGLICIIILIRNKNGRKRMRCLSDYIKSCCLTFSLHDYKQYTLKDKGSRFPFTLAVMPAVLLQIVILR